MSVLNTNISSGIGVNALRSIIPDQALAMERLSTGKRINSSTDDAAGLAVKEKTLARVKGLNVAAKNTMDAISMIETVESKASAIADIFQRMRELAVQSVTGTNTPSDRLGLDLEFGELWNEIQRVALEKTWNEKILMQGFPGVGAAVEGSSNRVESFVLTHIDYKNAQTNPFGHLKLFNFKNYDLRSTFEQTAQMETDVRAYNAGAGQSKNFATNPFIAWPTWPDQGLPDVNTQGTSVYGSAVLYVGNGAVEGDITNSRIDIKTVNNASFTMTQLDAAINGISLERGKYASYMNRLAIHYDNLINRSLNQELSQSRIEDVNYALETKNLSKTKIMSEASTAILAQANQAKDVFLSLLERDDYIF